MASTNLIKSLGAADIDTAELVANLVNATKEPRQKLINSDKKKAEVAISSTALLKSALSTFQSVATELGSADKLNKLNLTSSDASIVTALKGSSGIAKGGNYGVEVLRLATNQRTVSSHLPINYQTPGPDFSEITLSRNGTPVNEVIRISPNSTPAQIVSTINSSPAALEAGVTATLINTGKLPPLQIVLQSRSGDNEGFEVSESGASFGFSVAANTISSASNAELKINGIELERPSNTITDAIPGVSLSLTGASAGREVQIGVSMDASALVDGARNLVESYNLLSEFLKRATGPLVEGDDIAGSLRSDSTARSIRVKLRETLTSQSRSPAGAITHWSSMGLALDRDGVLKLDESKFIKAFQDSPQDAITAISNNASSPYIFSGMPSGLAGDLAITAYGMVRSTGVVSEMTAGYSEKLKRVEQKQTKFDQEMSRLQMQYERQFSALNSVLASFKDTQAQLEKSLNFNSKD
jgi:flagellar hook-associated protein 2